MPFAKRAFKFVPIAFATIALLFGGFVCVVFFYNLGFMGYYLQNHDKSEYPNNVVFGGVMHGSDYSLIPFVISRVNKSYEQVIWTNEGESPDADCPLTIEADGKIWKPEDFEFEAFLKSGAEDDRIQHSVSVNGERTSRIDLSMPLAATYSSRLSDLSIRAVYNDKKILQHVQVGPNWTYDSLPKKDYRITISQGSVTLPADHSDILKGLGQPTKHTPPYKVYLSRVP